MLHESEQSGFQSRIIHPKILNVVSEPHGIASNLDSAAQGEAEPLTDDHKEATLAAYKTVQRRLEGMGLGKERIARLMRTSQLKKKVLELAQEIHHSMEKAQIEGILKTDVA